MQGAHPEGMSRNQRESTRIAIEYVTARLSQFRDAASADALEEATEHVYELVDGLAHLVVGLAGRVAEAEGVTVAEVLQHEVLTPFEDRRVVYESALEEVPVPDQGEQHLDIPAHDPAREPVREPVRVRRLQAPKQAAVFLEIDDEPDLLRPDTWDA